MSEAKGITPKKEEKKKAVELKPTASKIENETLEEQMSTAIVNAWMGMELGSETAMLGALAILIERGMLLYYGERIILDAADKKMKDKK